jgi:hypothetical protein
MSTIVSSVFDRFIGKKIYDQRYHWTQEGFALF